MRILNNYLSRNVAIGVLMALIVLSSLDALMAFIYEYNSQARGDFGLVQVLWYIVLTLPRRMYDFFPTAMLLGGLLSLGGMATHSELTAIRAAGVPIYGIVRSVLRAGLIMMLAAIAVGEFVAPLGDEKAESMKVAAQTGSLLSTGHTRLWVREGRNFIGIREVLPDLHLQGVSIYELDDNMKVTSAIYAPRASYNKNADEWMLYDVRKVVQQGVDIEYEHYDKYKVKRLLSPELFNVVVVSPEKMSALSLSQYVKYLSDNNLDASRYELAFWVRFTTPLSSLVMLLIAMPFVFSSQRSGGFGQNLFIGILVGIIFFIVNRMLNHMGLVYGLPPFLSASLPLLMFMGAAVLALRRIR